MAQSLLIKKKGTANIDLPECPVCLEVMSSPIYNCQSGHSLCANCTANLCPAICPICRQPMTQMRNRALEDYIAKAKVSCPNKANGCIYTFMIQELDNHLLQCIFREMVCPLGAAFGKCSWKGTMKNMLDHFKESHPENCNVSTDSDVELDNVSITVDDRYIYLVTQGKMLFIVTMKIDTTQKMAYWIVQHIGSKKTAQQHVYEIHITSKQDSRRKVTFFEYCCNDAMKTDEIFYQGKCGIMPLGMLKHFIKDKKLAFRFLIRRIPDNTNQNIEKIETNPSHRVNPGGSTPQGPRSRRVSRSRGPGPRGLGPRGSRQKSPGFHHGDRRSSSPFVYQ